MNDFDNLMSEILEFLEIDKSEEIEKIIIDIPNTIPIGMVSLNTIGENSSGLKPTIIINEKYNNNTKVLNVTLIRF